MKVQRLRIKFIIISAEPIMKQHEYITVQIERHGGITQEMGTIIIIIIIIIIIGGGGGGRPQSKYDSVAFSSITYTDACGRLLFRSLTVQPR
jgi:hypothetical protein